MFYATIDVWEPKDYPRTGADGFRPTIATYILESTTPRGLVVICPGGGYQYTSPREAEPVALQFTAAGFHAVVLHYSVAPRRHPQPLWDLCRTISLIRERAQEWQVDPHKIAVCGFSAGGHLAATLGVYWNMPVAQRAPGILAGMNQPNALILCYPVISSGTFRHQGSFENLIGAPPTPELLAELSLEKHVNAQTPPTFLWHTVADPSVPVENSLLFAQALQQQRIPFEFHIFSHGGHGLALATPETATDKLPPDRHVAGWMRLCVEWLHGVFAPVV